MERIYHTFDKWECYPAGFYEEKPPAGMSKEDCEAAYRDLLSNIPLFEKCLERVISEWKYSCEHYLSNDRMNRIAWLGQASLAIHLGIPARFRNGYNLLTEEQQRLADKAALRALNEWLTRRGEAPLSMTGAESKTEANLY